MFKAWEAMTREVISVKEDIPVIEAMNILVDNNITGLPVVSNDMHLLGIISEKDMLNLLYHPRDKPVFVSEVMTREVVRFDEFDDLFEVCECLINNNFRRVPVMSGDKLVGVISRRDIIKFILKIRKEI